jgi:hypothetical protein
MVRARACTGCREYVLIKADDPDNINLLKEFEAEHRGHMLITLNFDEIKGAYKQYRPAGED